MINYLEVRPSRIQPDANVFIDIDGELAILLEYEEYEKSLCYMPSFREVISIDKNFNTLDIIG